MNSTFIKAIWTYGYTFNGFRQKHWSKVCHFIVGNKTITDLYKQIGIHFLKKILSKSLAHLAFKIKIWGIS